MSPDTPALAVPATACDVIASPPSLMLVQFAPRLPSARLKSSEPIIPGLAAQETATLVTLADPIVPEPLATAHVCPAGLVIPVTAYPAPLASAVANVNGPLAETVRLSPPLSCSTTDPDDPDTVPPTVYVALPTQPPAPLSTWAAPL